MEIIETNLDFNGLTKRSKTNRIIIHHSGVTVLQSVEVIHNYHKNTNGWAGIGYHFYVRKDGKIYRGRPEDTVGAHAYGANTDSIGICFEGNFGEETMNEVQIKAGQELVAYLKSKWGISTVIGHRDVGSTACPGANFPMDAIVNGTPVAPAEKETITMKTYQNGSTVEPVYADTDLRTKVGYLNPYERCDCYGVFKGRAVVRYKIDGMNEYKIGFAEWLDGIE